MNPTRYTLPFSENQIKALKAGEIILLSGKVFTARDAAHKRISDALQIGIQPPFELKNAAVYYCGPAPAKKGEIIGSCGPTTSARMDSYTPALIERGLKVMIGKGCRSRAVIESIKKHGAVYLAAIGGAGALIKNRIISCKIAAYADLGCEAIYELELKDLPLLVSVDSGGNSALAFSI